MGPAEGQPTPQAGAAGPSSLGSRLPPAPLGGRRVLVVCGKAQVPVSPPAFSLLFLLVLQGPLPGQAGGDGGSAQPQGDAQSVPVADTGGRGAAGRTSPCTPTGTGGLLTGVPHIPTAMGVHLPGHPSTPTGTGVHQPGLPHTRTGTGFHPAWAPRDVAGWSLLSPKEAGEPGRARL